MHAKIHDTTIYRLFKTLRAHAADVVAKGEAGADDDVEAFVPCCSDITLSST